MPGYGSHDLTRAIVGKVNRDLEAAAHVALEEVTDWLVEEIKKVVGVPAGPQRRNVRGLFRSGFRVVTPATVGAPPRKVTGRGQRSVRAAWRGKLKRAILADAKSKKGFRYMEYHEAHDHPFVKVTVDRLRQQIKERLNKAIKRELKKRSSR